MKKLLMIFAMMALPFAAHAAEDAFAEVNAKMHHDMMVQPTGDVDADFVRGMIPHHQGAVDMAEIVVKKGKDKKIRALAREIIHSQKKEIIMMQNWLQDYDKKQAKVKKNDSVSVPADHMMDHSAHH